MVPGSSPLLLARQKNSVSGSSLRVELVRFRVHYDLPKPSDWRQNHQDHPENDADPVGEPREAEPLGLVDREPHDAGKLAEEEEEEDLIRLVETEM